MSRCSAACAASPNPALDVPGSASESPSSIALHTMPRNRGALPAIAACERTSSTPDATRLSSTSRCSMPAKPHNYDRFKPFGALGDGSRSSTYRSRQSAPGILEALLTKLALKFKIINGTPWSVIQKYVPSKGDPSALLSDETKNVLCAAQDARDAGADALVFVRDSDR